MPVNYKLYPADWNDVIRPAILKRDNYKCKSCFAGQRAQGYRDSKKRFVECDQFMLIWAKANGKKIITIHLSIAHLDQDITNNDPSNLAAFCQQCHNRHDAQQRAFKRSIFYKQIKSKKPARGH